MELEGALEKANQILDEERSSPTVQYSIRSKRREPTDSIGQFADLVAKLKEPEALQFIRCHRPRRIVEDPKQWVFQSVNYNLLCALLSQLPSDLHLAFLVSVLARLVTPPGCGKCTNNVQPSWNGFVSELPLVVEFCARNGAKREFFRALEESNPILGHAVLLRHIEDMIALNFTVFAEEDYGLLTTAITTLGYTTRKLLKAARDTGAAGRDSAAVCVEIIEAVDGIKEECRKAQYLYLKGALLEGLNLEVNQDKEAVNGFLENLGFSPALIECLNQADRLYRESGDAFSLKSCMGHLRSFLENLHTEALPALQAKVKAPAPEKWGQRLVYLREHCVLSKAEEGFVAGLYILISDEAVHPLIAEREYARLARNMVIEYALLFLRKLEKSGLTLQL